MSSVAMAAVRLSENMQVSVKPVRSMTGSWCSSFSSHTNCTDFWNAIPASRTTTLSTPELNGYWKLFGRVDLGTTWFFHAPVPLGTTKDNFNFREYLYSAVGAELDLEFEHIGFWELRVAIADTYREGG